MRRHHILPTFFAALAVLGIATAVLVESPSLPRAIALTRTTSTTVATTTTTIDPAVLTAALDAVWQMTPQPATSCLIVQLGNRVVYERNPDVAVIPASTTKLLTALAASERLALDERLVTEAVARAPVVDGVVDGDLELVGDDPVLGNEAWAATLPRAPRAFTSLDVLADRLTSAGVREVRGGVIGDVRVNDRADDGAGVFTTLLRERGVVIGHAAGGAPAGGAALASVESAPLAEIVADMVRASDNETAVWLTRRMGGPDAIRDALAARGFPLDGVAVHDGSGRDRRDRVTCRVLVAVLSSLDRNGPIADGLAVAGRTGTLNDRMLDPAIAGRLRAKTGTVRGVAGLAGFAESARGELVFAHVLNGTSERDAHAILDAVAFALVHA